MAPTLYTIHLLLTTTLLTTSTLVPRRSASQIFDPWIMCESYAPHHSEGLPPAYNEDVYTYLTALCSVAHGARQNVGCFCSSASSDIHCDPHVADATLWAAKYRSAHQGILEDYAERMGYPDGEVPFPAYCADQCYCKDHEGEWGDTNTSFPAGYDHTTAAGADGLSGPSDTNQRGGGEPDDYGTFGEASFRDSGQGQGQGQDQPAWHNQCGNNCTASSDCKAPAGSGGSCTCRTQSSQYQPGSGTLAFVAACLVTLGTGGKRDEDWPCPCNSTYVSHGCCGASDGLVWEAAGLKMGELMTVDDL